MKHLFVLAASLFCLPMLSAAPICTTGTLLSYENLGAGGCTIGTNTLASFTTLTGSAGTTAISPGAITIRPGGSTTNPALTFQFSQTANPGQTEEAIFDYAISGAAYIADMLSLSNSSESGNGGVSDAQNFCAGGSFGSNGVSGCTGTTSGGLVTIDGAQNTDHATLTSPHLLSITDDIVVDSGGVGTASGGIFVDQFTATAIPTGAPEPATYLLFSTGIAVAALRHKKGRLAHA
jgi:hypothetical protein